MWPDEASWVSRYGNPASSGVSLISQKSNTAHPTKMIAGMKNTAQVASVSPPAGTKIPRRVVVSQSGDAGSFAVVISTIACPHSNAK